MIALVVIRQHQQIDFLEGGKMGIANISISPSRTYVALCDRPEFKGYYMKKFTLPENCKNDSQEASWYFLNRLNYSACILTCISFEDYSDISVEAQ